MKGMIGILLLAIGFFVGMIFERMYYPRANEAQEMEASKAVEAIANEKLILLKDALNNFDFKGMNNDKQEIKVTQPLDFCIQSQDADKNYIVGVGVTTKVLGDRPPDMPEMMHSYWLFKVIASADSVYIESSIPTFSYDCKWINFEELQKEADEEVE